MQKVNFQKADAALTLPAKTELKAFIENLFKKEEDATCYHQLYILL